MGCTSSKQLRRTRQRSPQPYFRTQSMPLHQRGSSGKVRDSGRHVVALTSSTLGSLRLDSDPDAASDDELMMKCINDGRNSKDTQDVVEKAKAWSDMIERRIPKTIAEPPCEEQPETINAWELMAGLEDDDDEVYADAENMANHSHHRSFSFSNATASPKPLWMHIAPGDSIVSDFDPDIIFNFQKTLDELSPRQHQMLLSSPEPERTSLASTVADTAVTVNKQNGVDDIPKLSGIVKARVSAFQEKIDAKKIKKPPPNGERRVVFYFTSLRGIRKTYEDCWAVKVILRGYGIRVDERDVSMHGGFKDELNELLGAGFGGSRLPRVFANGKYLGGAEEVRQMHECGELGKALEECEVRAVGKGLGVCEACGDMRFVPCEECFGSCKVFVESEGDERDDDVVVTGFRRCPDCNENGLVRCPICC